VRIFIAVFVMLTLAACGPEKKAPPPYKQPSVEDILRAAKEEEALAAKAKVKAKAAAVAKAKAEGKPVEKEPPLTPKQIATKQKSAKKNQVASVTFALCGWASAKRDSFAGYGKTQKPPAAGYYCDTEIMTAAKRKKKRRVFMFRSEDGWQLFQVDKKFASKLKNFAQVDPAELAAYEAAEEAKKNKGKKKKKPATS